MGYGENLMDGIPHILELEVYNELIRKNKRLKKLVDELQQEIKDFVEQHPMEDK